MAANLYAHSRDEAGQRHLLDDHLRAVATLAARFAAPFGGGEFAGAAGWLHDIGKASPEFQAYLAACDREPDRRHKSVDHKGAGTLAGIRLEENLAFLIQGHHGGLLDQADILHPARRPGGD